MAQTKVFFDLEFTGLHKLTTPISIAMVAEDGRSFYAEFTDFDKFQIDDYVRQHVLTKRLLSDFNVGTDYQPDSNEVIMKGDIDKIFTAVTKWLTVYAEDGVQMWGDMLAYDWVLFINIFGSGQALPSFIDVIPLDLCTALKLCGEDPHVDRLVFAYGEENAESAKKEQNNALFDAKTSIEIYKKLMQKMADDKNTYSVKEDDSLDDGSTDIVGEDRYDLTKDFGDIVKEEGNPLEEQVKKHIPKKIHEIKKPTAAAPKVKAVKAKAVKAKAVKEKAVKEKSAFTEPTQEYIDSSEEFNPPIKKK